MNYDLMYIYYIWLEYDARKIMNSLNILLSHSSSVFFFSWRIDFSGEIFYTCLYIHEQERLFIIQEGFAGSGPDPDPALSDPISRGFD